MSELRLICVHVSEKTLQPILHVASGQLLSQLLLEICSVWKVLFLWTLVEVWLHSNLTGKFGNEEHVNLFQVFCGLRWSHSFLRHVFFHFL